MAPTHLPPPRAVGADYEHAADVPMWLLRCIGRESVNARGLQAPLSAIGGAHVCGGCNRTEARESASSVRWRRRASGGGRRGANLIVGHTRRNQAGSESPAQEAYKRKNRSKLGAAALYARMESFFIPTGEDRTRDQRQNQCYTLHLETRSDSKGPCGRVGKCPAQ